MSPRKRQRSAHFNRVVWREWWRRYELRAKARLELQREALGSLLSRP